MLVLKTIASPTEFPRTIVFDEIDTGIGGRVSAAVGVKLKASRINRRSRASPTRISSSTNPSSRTAPQSASNDSTIAAASKKLRGC